MELISDYRFTAQARALREKSIDEIITDYKSNAAALREALANGDAVEFSKLLTKNEQLLNEMQLIQNRVLQDSVDVEKLHKQAIDRAKEYQRNNCLKVLR